MSAPNWNEDSYISTCVIFSNRESFKVVEGQMDPKTGYDKKDDDSREPIEKGAPTVRQQPAKFPARVDTCKERENVEMAHRNPKGK